MASALLHTQIHSQVEAALAARIPAALTFRTPPPPEMLSTGIAAIDQLTGGLPRGALTEICGPASSGRTSLLASILAQLTTRGEVCALVDASDAFHPHSAAAVGVDLEKLLWIRCGAAPSPSPSTSRMAHGGAKPAIEVRNGRAYSRGPAHNPSYAAMEQALKVADLLLQAGGFGLVAIDLGDIPALHASRVPLTSWFRFRRAVEGRPTALLLLEQEPHAGTCASLVLRMQRAGESWSAAANQAEVCGLAIPFAASPAFAVPSAEKPIPWGGSSTALPTHSFPSRLVPVPPAPAAPTHATLLRSTRISAHIDSQRMHRQNRLHLNRTSQTDFQFFAAH